MTSDIDPEQLKELFAQAADIAAGVPEPMQDAAFNRALDQLLGHPKSPGPTRDQSKRQGRKQRNKSTSQTDTTPGAGESPAGRLIAEINRTVYPQIFSATTVLDRALHVLRLAEEDFGVELLSAPEIAQILVEKFRLPTTHQAVRQALGARPQYVDTTQVKRGAGGRSVLAYRIMSPGTDFLDGGGTTAATEGSTSSAEQAPKARARRKTTRKRQPSATEATKAGAKSGRANRSPAPSTRKKGPKTALVELISEGFFDEPRLIGDTRERLRHKKGLNFTLQDLSPTLVRLLREGSLDREQNDSGQYEYRRP